MCDKKSRVRRSNSEVSSTSSSSTSSFSSDEETDARDLKPIRGYLSNRRELARQLFKSVKTEKIRMMLPQILKNMNLNDLEEWCGSELSGMSEARIISIVNGQPMLDSSDTDETDDSGPSLEIISDTEEWLTDTDVGIKDEPSSSGSSKTKKIKVNKSKGKNIAGKKNDIDKSRVKIRGKVNNVPTTESNVKVKKEKEKDNRTVPNKEGESLLDLLELEMRARAIRALIRKEEDIIPSAASEKRMAQTANALRNTLNSAVSASLSSEKSLNGKFDLIESSAKNGDKSVLNEPGRSPNATENVEDEDVVFLVVQPTPTIELLSSDNDEENGNDGKKEKKKENVAAILTETVNTRQNKNDKTPEIASNRDNAITTNERIVTLDKSGDGTDKLKIVITKRVSESSNSPSPSKSGKSKKSSSDRVGEKIIATSSTSAIEKTSEKINADAGTSGKGLFKKIKKKQHLRNKRKVNTENSNTDLVTIEKSVDATSGKNENENLLDKVTPIETETTTSNPVEKDVIDTARVPDVQTIKLEAEENREKSIVESVAKIDETEAKKKARRRITLDEDFDFEEIIDLDNYSDDMEDMENNVDSKLINDEANNVKTKPVQEEPKITAEESGETKEQSESSETWASRYYQTDDVQNVMKESKIQSEIRKRLRERQRQSKLNSSPKLNSPAETTVVVEKTDDRIEIKATGSVQEYLALKNPTPSSTDDNDADADVNTVVGENKSPDREESHLNEENSQILLDENTSATNTTNSTDEPTTQLTIAKTTETQ